jgi:phosphoribosylformylglycinamidine synthase
MPGIAPEVYTSMGLLPSEYELIVELMGRHPSLTEVGMFSVMWSEHCGYKYSRPILAYFRQYREAMEGAGLENAGVVSLGDGLGVTMKVESHNHPSAVEPYQGAATGVGGIIRDILTMGARPIAGLNSLRFGTLRGGVEPDEVQSRNRYLFERVVAGIAGYGNCVGVPTVAGEVSFHPRYSGNPLVNAMCVGIVPLDSITTAAAAGPGNPVLYLGSSTGRDGIHGATFASDALGEDSASRRPNVQIGDPFAEKQLIEATLEALATGAVVAIQDMGAAGITCSTIEMSSKGSVGMDIDLDRVPVREQDMGAYEIMLSESQERMLAVVRAGREPEVIDIFQRWRLHAVVIGQVTAEPRVVIRHRGAIEAELDPKLLTDHCPVYTTEIQEPERFAQRGQWVASAEPLADPLQDLCRLMAYPDIAYKRWVFEQYDQQVQTQTRAAFTSGGAAVLCPRGTRKGIALTLGGNARQVYADPYQGSLGAVAAAARTVACTGARPIAVTDGLNFGNPQLPPVYWQFERSVKGIADAANALGTPVISGNVSFYNQSDLGEILPTPLIGMLGVIEDYGRAVPSSPSEPGSIYCVSVPRKPTRANGLGASAYLAERGEDEGKPEPVDLEGEARLIEFLVQAAEMGALESAHGESDGGLLVAVARMALQSGFGAMVKLSDTQPSTLFGEFPGRVLVTGNTDALEPQARSAGLQWEEIGMLTHEELFKLETPGGSWYVPMNTVRDAYEGAIGRAMGR